MSLPNKMKQNRIVRNGVASLACLFVFIVPGIAFAAGGDGHGSPWMDLFYKTLNFAVLVGVLFYFLRKPVSGFLKGSTAKLKTTLDETRKEADDLAQRLEDQKKNIASLQKELLSLKDDARKEAVADKEKLKEEADTMAVRFKEQAKIQVEQARNQALDQIRKEIAKETVSLAEKQLQKQIDSHKQRELLGEHMNNLESRS